jgi:hypothetical protein
MLDNGFLRFFFVHACSSCVWLRSAFECNHRWLRSILVISTMEFLC